MKPNATRRKQAGRRHSYSKVLDNRKHPIRGLWRRNGRFIARITVEDERGQPRVKWHPLDATTVAQAQNELRSLLVERRENRLRHIGESPKFGAYLETYLERLETSGKKPETIVTEKGHYNRWREAIGHLRLDKIRPHHITSHLHALKSLGRSSRTCNLALVCLRNVLKAARIDDFLKALPTEGLPWMKVETKARELFTPQEIELFCRASIRATKNGQQFSDYIRFLAFSGAREQEALKVRWADVDFERQQVLVGAEGDTKNRECRRVDMSPTLKAHLEQMWKRRQQDSRWLFPSPQRGDKDIHARTFRESLLLTRSASGAICQTCHETTFGDGVRKCQHCKSKKLIVMDRAFPEKLQRFGFHDARHHFISYCVMSGLDYMTIARWAGHKDGGILIGKVYGHLSDEHARNQAARVSFGPQIVSAAASE
jgi:integrase